MKSQEGIASRRWIAAAVTFALAWLVAPAPVLALNAYITNNGDNTVSVIDTSTNAVIGSAISVGKGPYGVAVTPDGKHVYVANSGDNTVSVIDTATNAVIGSAISVGKGPHGVAVTPDGKHVYVANSGDNTVSVIDTATSAVATITDPAFSALPNTTGPFGVAVTPDGSKVYISQGTATNTTLQGAAVSVIDTASNTVISPPSPISLASFGGAGVEVTGDGSKVYVVVQGAFLLQSNLYVIDTATNTPTSLAGFDSEAGFGVAIQPPNSSKVYVSLSAAGEVQVVDPANPNTITKIGVGSLPLGVSVTPDGSKVYVANYGDGTVSVIDTTTNAVIGTPISVGTNPVAFGQFIQPLALAGTPSSPNCAGSSIAALAQKFGGLAAAAKALGFPSVAALQKSIATFCGG